MPTPIELIQEGGESLVSARRANEIITPLNAILSAKVSPIANVGMIKYAGDSFILDLTALDGRLRAVEANIATAGSGGNVSPNQFPFGIYDTSPNANFAQVMVRYGAVGNIIPTGVSTAINLSMPNSNTTVYLNITIDNNAAVTGAEISTGNSVPSPNTATKAYSLIGNVRVTSSAVALVDQALLFSQTFVTCGRNVSDPTTTPGTYYLQVS